MLLVFRRRLCPATRPPGRPVDPRRDIRKDLPSTHYYCRVRTWDEPLEMPESTKGGIEKRATETIRNDLGDGTSMDFDAVLSD